MRGNRRDGSLARFLLVVTFVTGIACGLFIVSADALVPPGPGPGQGGDGPVSLSIMKSSQRDAGFENGYSYNICAGDPLKLSWIITDGNTGEPIAGILQYFIRWDGLSWETSPVLASARSDAAGIVTFPITECEAGTFYYTGYLPEYGVWSSDYVTVNVADCSMVTFDKDPYTDIKYIGTLTITDKGRCPTKYDEHFPVSISSYDTTGALIGQPTVITVAERDIGSRVFLGIFGFSDKLPASPGYVPVSPYGLGHLEVMYRDRKFTTNYNFASTLRGQVWDMTINQNGVSSIKPIAGVDVKVTGHNPPFSKHALTNGDGVFIVDPIPPGSYTVSTDFISPTTGSRRTYSTSLDISYGNVGWVELPANILQIMKRAYKDRASQDYIRLRLAYVKALRTYTYTSTGLTIVSMATVFPESALEWCESMVISANADQLAGIGFDRLIESTNREIENLQKGINDPPDPDYTVVYPVQAPNPVVLPPNYSGNLSPAYIGLVNNLTQQAAIEDALLVSFERYQGALAADQLQYMKLQLDAIEEYSSLLEQADGPFQDSLDDVLAEIQANKQAHEPEVKAIQARLSASGFTEEEHLTLLENGMNETEIESYRQFLISFDFDEAIAGINDLQVFSQSRGDFGGEMGSQAAEVGSFLDAPKLVIALPSNSLPTDPDNDGIYEDLNGNGRLDFADVVLYFNQMTWIAANEPIEAFDLNGNGRIDFADIVALFNEI